ncbi:MAG: hypothetical protein V5A55_07540 [Halovenus sp.]
MDCTDVVVEFVGEFAGDGEGNAPAVVDPLRSGIVLERTLRGLADTAGCKFVKIFATPGW